MTPTRSTKWGFDMLTQIEFSRKFERKYRSTDTAEYRRTVERATDKTVYEQFIGRKWVVIQPTVEIEMLFEIWR